eukprot:TRINITY_DN9397_c0_g1_i2.p1 TRINITY_DN9397_c0_g1~~TRINITY_DN9397_c0_g1_i2.p1  ORF type:complete len:298 (-),score=29.92 TRINITY_DN9397_c0_g1_i2:240-1133(-)
MEDTTGGSAEGLLPPLLPLSPRGSGIKGLIASHSNSTVPSTLTQSSTPPGDAQHTPMPSDRLLRLVVLFTRHHLISKEFGRVVDQSEIDALTRALINVSIPAGSTLNMIAAVLEGEFETNCKDPGSIMRSNCLASKLTGVFSRMRCADYLSKAVGPIVEEVMSDEACSLEIDPRKLMMTHGEGANIEDIAYNNLMLLIGKTSAVVSMLSAPQVRELLPREMRAIASVIAELSKIYAADRLLPLVGGFIMLRLVNPSLVTPESYGILPDGMVPSLSARRNLTLMSKLLQNLSNDVLFG